MSLVYKKNLIFSTLEKISRAVLTLVSLIVVGRYLGPLQYGHLNYLIAIVTYFQVFAVFGLDQVLIGKFIKGKESSREIFWHSFSFKSVMFLIGFLLYLVILFFENAISWQSLFFGSAILSSVLDNQRIYLESQNQHSTIAKVDLLYQFSTAFLKIAACYFQLPVAVVIIIFILDYLIPKAFLFLYSGHLFQGLKINELKINFSSFKEYFVSGFYHCFSAFFAILYMKIDQVMVGKMSGMSELGNYSAAVRLSDAWYFLPVVVASVFYPSSFEKRDEKLNKNLQLIFDLTLWISIVIVSICLMFDDLLFSFLFGQDFKIDKRVLDLLFLSGIFISLTVSTNSWLNIRGKKEIIFLRTMIGALSNIVLNYFWIPRYGLVGCAWATFISYFLTFAFTFTSSGSSDCASYIARSLNPLGMINRFQEVLWPRK